jgi:predicted AlkP superfamily pyrophosphatase or phosphodiesterase
MGLRSGRRWLGLALVLPSALFFLGRASPEPRQLEAGSSPVLVLISVDGLSPDYVLAADAHGAREPNLRRMVAEGAYAQGVTGVIPSVTYPSHTAILTGVWPSKHGIHANVTFDPLRRNDKGWYWYAEDVRVPTLFDAAAQAGLVTASVHWPATVSAHIDYDLPEFWRAGTDDDQKLLRTISTPGLLAELQKELGPYASGLDASIEADETRARFAERLLETHAPGVLALHLIALDHIEHETGPFTPQSTAVVERIDAVIGRFRATAERIAPGRAHVCVVSDHGFAATHHKLNLFVAFRRAGLLTVNAKGKITAWKAAPWVAGGSAAIVLKDPADEATRAGVRSLLERLARDPANGIDRILDAEELHSRGGFPEASFLVALKPGWKTDDELAGPLVARDKPGGAHGYLPDLPEMRAAFFLVGPGVPAHRALGVMDMRDIAPTLAHVLHLSLPSADGKNLLP